MQELQRLLRFINPKLPKGYGILTVVNTGTEIELQNINDGSISLVHNTRTTKEMSSFLVGMNHAFDWTTEQRKKGIEELILKGCVLIKK